MIFHLKIFYHTEGKLLRIPGLPAMYDHEFFPQYFEVCLLELTEPILNEFIYVQVFIVDVFHKMMGDAYT